jgi:hypothetical protein
MKSISSELVQADLESSGEHSSELKVNLKITLRKSRLSPKEVEQLGEDLLPLQTFLLTPLEWVEV